MMINDIFESIPKVLGSSLFADYGALWKRRGNVVHIVKTLQEGFPFKLKDGEQTVLNRVLNSLWKKTKLMFFKNKKIR